MTQDSVRADILSISNELPCTVTTVAEHGFTTHRFVRLTNLNGARNAEPVAHHGEDQLNNNRYRIVVTGVDTFYLEEPVTFKKVDSSNFTPYIEGGYCLQIEQDFFYN